MSIELRVAVVTDIHGNLQALRAVLDDIQRRGPFDRLIAGGDFLFAVRRLLRVVADRRCEGMSGHDHRTS